MANRSPGRLQGAFIALVDLNGAANELSQDASYSVCSPADELRRAGVGSGSV